MQSQWHISQNFEDLPREVFVFGSEPYLKALQEAFGEIWIARYQQRNKEAWFAFYLHRQGPFQRAVTPPLTPYSPIGQTPDRQIPWQRLWMLLKGTYSFNSHQLPFLSQEFPKGEFPQRSTLVWDFGKEDWAPDKSTRRRLRQAEELGLRIEEGAELALLAEAYLALLTRKSVKPPYDALQMSRFLKRLEAEGLLLTHTVYREDVAVYYSAMVVDAKAKGLYVLCTAPAEGFEDYPSHYFLNAQLLELCKEKYQFIDHCGAEIPSIAHFKSKFSNRQLEYPGLEFWSGPVSHFLYETLRKIKISLKKTPDNS